MCIRIQSSSHFNCIIIIVFVDNNWLLQQLSVQKNYMNCHLWLCRGRDLFDNQIVKHSISFWECYYSVTAIYWHKFKCVCTAHFIKYNRKIGNNLVFIVAFYLNKWFFFASMLRFIKQFVMGRAEDCTSRFCQLAKASKISIGHKCMGVCTDNQRMGDSKFAFLPR